MGVINQTNIVFIVIILICSAKLFKDYLYRNRYIEGMTINTQGANKPLYQSASDVTGIELYFFLTLQKPIASGETFTMIWVDTNSSLTFTDAAASYTMTNAINNTVLAITTTTTSTASPVTFTASAVIPNDTKIKITVKNVTIKSSPIVAPNTGNPITFTFTNVSGGEAAVRATVNILPAANVGTYVGSSASTVDEITAAVNEINRQIAITKDASTKTALQRTQTALINLLTATYSTVRDAGQVFTSGSLYDAQKTALDFISKEKSRVSGNANTLESDNRNKKRMSQINTYYTQSYEANTEIMKDIIYISISLIVLAVLKNRDLIPPSIATLGTIFILTIGSIKVGTKVYDILRRNNMEFDKYDWSFNEESIDSNKMIKTDTSALSDMSNMMGGGQPCYGPGCCDTGTAWDAVGAKCKPQGLTGTATWVSGTGTMTIKITPSVDVTAGKNVMIKYQQGLFSGTPVPPTADPYTATPTISKNSITLTLATGKSLTKGTEYTISITGLSMIEPSSVIKQISVSTDLEPFPVTIPIN